MKTSKFLALGLCGALTLGSARAADEDTSSSTGNSVQNIPASTFAPSSAGVDDVIKLAKSGVGDSVVISYIKQSQVAYQPSAQEIIKMKDEGLSSQVITAVIERGGEVREQVAAATPAAPATTTAQPAPATQTTTVYTYAEPPPVYVDPTPNVIVIGRGYPTYPFASIGWSRPYCYSGGYYGGRYYYHGGWGGGSRFVAIGHNGGGGFRASSHAGYHHR